MYFRALLIGLALGLATFVSTVVAAMLGASFLLPGLIFFGAPSAYFLKLIIPEQFIYKLVPGGGGAAFIGISLVGALLQLIAIYSLIIYRLSYASRVIKLE